MPWTGPTHAVPVGPNGVDATSTSTVCVRDGSGYAWLRMFGLDSHQVALATGGDAAVLQAAAPAWTPVGATDGWEPTLPYFESGPVPEADPPAAFVFPDLTALAVPFLKSTVIPARKAVMVLDGETALPTYKDVHVLELRDGLGWLMVAGRYWAKDTLFGPVPPGYGGAVGDIKPDSTKSAVVAFWAPASDGTFTSNDVRGPVFLVSRVQDIDGTESVVWVGVPASVEVDEGAEPMVYFYYTAEPTTFAPEVGIPSPVATDFQRGTRVRTVRRCDLLGAFGLDEKGRTEAQRSEPTREVQIAGAAGFNLLDAITAHPYIAQLDGARQSTRAAPLRWQTSMSTDETLWNSAAGTWLVPGTDRGKVRIWVAAPGTRWQEADLRWIVGFDPGLPLIWEYFTKLRDLDAVPVRAGSELALFFTGHDDQDGLPDGRPQGHGIWRAAAVPSSVVHEEGLDFVVFAYVKGTDNPGDRDLVAEPASPDPQGFPIDPDPVQLPDGSWLLFCGWGEQHALSRLEGPDALVSAPWTDAWL